MNKLFDFKTMQSSEEYSPLFFAKEIKARNPNFNKQVLKSFLNNIKTIKLTNLNEQSYNFNPSKTKIISIVEVELNNNYIKNDIWILFEKCFEYPVIFLIRFDNKYKVIASNRFLDVDSKARQFETSIFYTSFHLLNKFNGYFGISNINMISLYDLYCDVIKKILKINYDNDLNYDNFYLKEITLEALNKDNAIQLLSQIIDNYSRMILLAKKHKKCHVQSTSTAIAEEINKICHESDILLNKLF